MQFPSPRPEWSVELQENGRHGTVTYREAAGVLSFYWEFGGGDALATVVVGTARDWCAQPAWAAARRTEIVSRIAAEVVRQKAPGHPATIDWAGGWIVIHATAPGGTPPAATGVVRRRPFLSKSTLMLILAAVILTLAVVGFGVKSLFSVRVPHGAPLGDSARAGDAIVTLIQTLEPYVPSLHRQPGNDRYRLALFVQPVDATQRGRLLPIARELTAESFHLARILGYDGTNVWLNAHRLVGVDLRTGKLRGEDELAQSNPSLPEAWDDPRRFTFEGRLRFTSEDRQRVFEIDPVTLAATPVQPRRGSAPSPFAPKLEQFLSAGARPTPTEWIGVLSQTEAERHYQPGSWLRPLNRAEDAKQLRRLYRGQLGPELDRGNRAILSLAPVAEAEFLNAAFVCSGADAEPLRLAAPDGFLMAYTSAPGLQGTLRVARVDTTAKIAWDTDTGLDRFKLAQVLPDPRVTVFVGTRLPVPDKVSEPLLVFVDTATGKISTVSLWQ